LITRHGVAMYMVQRKNGNQAELVRYVVWHGFIR